MCLWEGWLWFEALMIPSASGYSNGVHYGIKEVQIPPAFAVPFNSVTLNHVLDQNLLQLSK